MERSGEELVFGFEIKCFGLAILLLSKRQVLFEGSNMYSLGDLEIHLGIVNYR